MGVYDATLQAGQDLEAAVHASVAKAVEIFEDWDEWRETTVYNSWNLARIPVWYAEHFGTQDCLEWLPSPSAEIPTFIEYSWELPYRGVILNGRFDNVVRVFGETLILDRKTTGKQVDGDFIKRFSPDIQFTLYPFVFKKLFPELGTPHILCEAIQLQVSSVDFSRFTVRRTKDEFDEFEDMLNRAIDRLIELEGQPERSYIQNQTACYFCPFKGLCAASTQERNRKRGLIR